MNKTIDQIDFNFSRPLDIQKNLSIEKVRNFFSKIFDLDFKNDLLEKHLKLLVIELFYCWYESENQFLSLSMSKRGYNSKSRYNPNEISSYTIKAVNFLKEKKLIDFFPGFFDRKSYVRRLTRIRPSKKLKSFFSNSILTIEKKINHPNREFLILKDNYKKLLEYSDNFQTHEIRELLTGYNNLISKSLIDIPVHEQNYLERYDKKKIIISETNSQANLFCLNNFNNIQGFSGCWWNELDINLIMRYEKKLLVNNQPTTYVDLNDIFYNFLSLAFNFDKIATENSILSEDFDSLQKNRIIIKGIHLNSYDALIRSVNLEKKNLFLTENISVNEIKKKIKLFLEKNDNISSFFFKGNTFHWSSIISKIFKSLLKTLVPANIPTFLVTDKIYFPSSFSETILERLNEILEKEFKIPKQSIKIRQCDDYHFKSQSFFSKIITPKTLFTKRYLNRVSNLRLK